MKTAMLSDQPRFRIEKLVEQRLHYHAPGSQILKVVDVATCISAHA